MEESIPAHSQLDGAHFSDWTAQSWSDVSNPSLHINNCNPNLLDNNFHIESCGPLAALEPAAEVLAPSHRGFAPYEMSAVGIGEQFAGYD